MERFLGREILRTSGKALFPQFVFGKGLKPCVHLWDFCQNFCNLEDLLEKSYFQWKSGKSSAVKWWRAREGKGDRDSGYQQQGGSETFFDIKMEISYTWAQVRIWLVWTLSLKQFNSYLGFTGRRMENSNMEDKIKWEQDNQIWTQAYRCLRRIYQNLIE